MKRFYFSLSLFALFCLLAPSALRAEMVKYIVDFEQFSDALNEDATSHGSSYGWSWNNTTDRMYSGPMPGGMFNRTGGDFNDLAMGYIEVDGVQFMSNYMGSEWGGMYYWEGFGISNVKDTTYAGYQNEMVSMTGTGANGSDVYGVIYGGGFVWENNPWLSIPTDAIISGMMLCNTVYAYDSMLNGDWVATSLDEYPGKYFDLIVNGYDENGELIGFVRESLGINRDGELDIPDDWFWLELSSLTGAISFEFLFESQEDSGYGINYPTYFAFDDLTYFIDDGNPPVPNPTTTPEPASALIFGAGLLGLGIIGRGRLNKKDV